MTGHNTQADVEGLVETIRGGFAFPDRRVRLAESALASLAAVVEGQRAALEYYADPDNHYGFAGGDTGEIARLALSRSVPGSQPDLGVAASGSMPGSRERGEQP